VQGEVILFVGEGVPSGGADCTVEPTSRAQRTPVQDDELQLVTLLFSLDQAEQLSASHLAQIAKAAQEELARSLAELSESLRPPEPGILPDFPDSPGALQLAALRAETFLELVTALKKARIALGAVCIAHTRAAANAQLHRRLWEMHHRVLVATSVQSITGFSPPRARFRAHSRLMLSPEGRNWQIWWREVFSSSQRCACASGRPRQQGNSPKQVWQLRESP